MENHQFNYSWILGKENPFCAALVPKASSGPTAFGNDVPPVNFKNANGKILSSDDREIKEEEVGILSGKIGVALMKIPHYDGFNNIPVLRGLYISHGKIIMTRVHRAPDWKDIAAKLEEKIKELAPNILIEPFPVLKAK